MNCRDFLSRMDAFLADRLEGVEAGDFRNHLRSCAACREVAVTADPVLLLSAAPLKEPSAEQVGSCVGAVIAIIHQDRLRRRIRKPGWRWMAAAAAAVVAVGAGLAWWASQPDFEEGGMLFSQGGVSVAAHREGPPPPHVEVEIPGGDVRVYRFANAGDNNTAVVYIVKESLDL